MLTLDSKVLEVSPIAKRLSARLKKMGIITILDLLNYFPFRYDDFSKLKKIKDLIPGDIITIKGRVDLIETRRSPVQRRILTEAVISDESGTIKVVWFNQPFLIKNIRQGENIYLSGKVEASYKTLQMTSPEYEKVKKITSTAGRFAPVYPLVAGVTNKHLRFFISSILSLRKNIKDWLSSESKQRLNFLDLQEALKQIHFPDNKEMLIKAQTRLKFNELFLIQLQSQIIKKKLKDSSSSKITFEEEKIKKFVQSLPFKLTNDQRKSSWAILLDMQKDYPMNRLLEGDVGSGKTIVSVIAMLNVAYNKQQSAYMAPTEILAKQQFNSLCKLYKNEKVKIGLLTRTEQKMCSMDENIKKKDFLNKISAGEIDIIVGTHALIQKSIEFKNLALVVIDEQHRFGVEQRKELSEKSETQTIPHFLSMTATPIPRSLHLALFGDLDLSIIAEMPKGRKKIITKIIEPVERQETYNFILNQIKEGKQVFVICPLINESDKLGVKSVTAEYEKLDKKIFPKIKIAALHGKMKTEEKEEIMQDFLENKTKILVATSVVEVGVDIPNATVMMIEGSERFGLSQLHQFRGRVGRSEYQSYCFLFNDSASEKVEERLQALVDSDDGFQIAKRDLELRGPGEVYGKSQSGFPEFKIASFFDHELIEKANSEASRVLSSDMDLENHPELKNKIEELKEAMHLE
ncbi:ATP-dependent DNA helicase RecG [Candidatus Falkowbacteria bacterium]|jgi:ATP-dependent DNA helicase RecG|nr:ATP-dependent DNA helicase RecG [Candidatus Falkowbacteria bacterium]MBT4433389.1 ATP-dependent DNA helicase RecG [Candidatus Falkowbacteria bacterium]